LKDTLGRISRLFNAGGGNDAVLEQRWNAIGRPEAESIANELIKPIIPVKKKERHRTDPGSASPKTFTLFLAPGLGIVSPRHFYFF